MDAVKTGAYIKQLGESWKSEKPGRKIADIYEAMGFSRQRWYQICRGDALGKQSLAKVSEFFGVSELELISAGASKSLSSDQYAHIAAVVKGVGLYESGLIEPLTPNDRAMLVNAALKMNIKTADETMQYLADLIPADS